MAPVKDKDKEPRKTTKSGDRGKPADKTAKKAADSDSRKAEAKSPESKKAVSKATKKAPAKGGKSTPRGKTVERKGLPEGVGMSSGVFYPDSFPSEEHETYVAYPQSTIAGVIPHRAENVDDAVVAVRATTYEVTPPDSIVEPVYPEEAVTELPYRYNETRLLLMVRDPEWIYMYWDVADSDRAALRMAPEQFSEALVVRLHDISGVEEFNGMNSVTWYEIPVKGGAVSWYVHLPQVDREWCGELGVLNERGEFIQICRSNRIRTPRNFISEEVDTEWMSVSEELREILARSADVAVSSSLSSGAAVRQISRRLRLALEARASASAGLSGSLRARPVLFGERGGRDLPLMVRTELILSGKTDPQAVLTVQNQPVTLRPDGTFTIRYELPDGEQVLPVKAATRDGELRREIVPVVRKETHRPDKNGQ